MQRRGQIYSALLILEKCVLIILHVCSFTAKKRYQYSWQYLLIIMCQCECFSWNGSTWIDANATLETAPLLYSCSVLIPPGISCVFIRSWQVFCSHIASSHSCFFMQLFCTKLRGSSGQGRSQDREVWVLPVLLEHTCTCFLWLCWQKGKVMKSRCYQFYKRSSILIYSCWSLPKLIIICMPMLNPARLLLKMSFFSNQ